MRTPPPGFVSSLQALDPLYHVRWGDAIRQWIIEREAVYSETERSFLSNRLRRLKAAPKRDAARLAEAFEEDLSAQGGRRVICFVNQLDSKVFDAVCVADVRRYGGWSRYADYLDAQDEKKEEALLRQQASQRDDLHRIAHDHMSFLGQHRIAQLEAGERDMNFLLHGYRTKPTTRTRRPITGPLIQVAGG